MIYYQLQPAYNQLSIRLKSKQEVIIFPFIDFLWLIVLSKIEQNLHKYFQMSSNFLQRFKGKTQAISKDGVHNILGGGSVNNNPYIYTHSNGLAVQQKHNSTQSQNMNSVKNTTQEISKKPASQNKMSKTNTHITQNDPRIPIKNQTRQSANKSKQIEEKKTAPDNPFLVSNPFYLDEEQRIRQEEQQNEMLRLEKSQAQRKKLEQQKKYQDDPKKGTYSSMNAHKSLNKKSQKEWAKLGGLGPNIGGEEWEEKKKKQQKMQDFASQVKVINSQKPHVPPKPIGRRDQRKDDPRSKALEYSKKVPKPLIKAFQRQQKEMQDYKAEEPDEKQLSELQLYELRHKQLQEILKNQL